MAAKLRKVEIIELNDAFQKVLIWFYSFPDKEMSLSDLASELQISKTTAHRVVTELVNQNFLKLEVLGRIWRVSCNKSHPSNYSMKIAYNLAMVYNSHILDDIHNVVPNPRSVILFGSYRKGDDNEKSDIDIAVEVLDGEEPRIRSLGIIPEFGHRKNVEVNLHIFSRSNVDLNLFANIANGIVLEGFLEVRP